MNRRFLSIAVFALLTLSFAAYAAQPDEMLTDPALEVRAKTIGEELRCLVCQNESIEDSAAPLAHDLRMLLRQRLSAGDSDGDAKEYIVARYGNYVLLKPPLQMSTLALWFGPVVLLLIALGFIVGFYRRGLTASQERVGAVPHKFPPPADEDIRAMQRLIVIVAPLLLLGAGLLYIHLGSPELPDRPYAERKNDPDFLLNASAENIALRLAAHPDADGYKHLAGMFYAIHRYGKAAEAARRATELNANDAETWSLLGESTVMENDGAVVMDALNDFKTARKHDANDPRARFYIGLAEAEIGDLEKAVSIWRDLEQTAPAGAPWLDMVKRNIASYAKQGGFDPATIPPAPPELK